MDYQKHIKEIAQQKHAVISYGSGKKEVYYFPYSLINEDYSEAFVSYRKGKALDVIDLRLRLYKDVQDNNTHPYTLFYGNPPQSIPLGNSLVPVKSTRKEAFVTRICSEIPLASLMYIVSPESFLLSDGNTSKPIKVSCDRTLLSLYLASCFGIDALPDDFKRLLVPLVQEEENRISQERQEEKRKREEDKERQRQEEEARINKQEQIRKKLEKERALLVEDTKGLLEIMWNLYQKNKKEGRFVITEYENEYCIQVNKTGITGNYSGSDYYRFGAHSRARIIKMVQLLCDAHIINDYQCKENSYVESNAIVVYIPDFYNHLPPLFRICSLQQLYDVLDNKTTIGDIRIKSADALSSGNNQETTHNNNGCYIATAIYGSYDCPEVWTLRRYRDQVLRNNWAGRVFIKIYYAVSPKVVALFGQKRVFQRLNRSVLDKWIKSLNLRGFGDSPYHDI